MLTTSTSSFRNLATLAGLLFVGGVAYAIECNTQNYGPTQPCNQAWPAAAFCDNWSKAVCNAAPSQQGAAPGAANQGPTFAVGCTEPDPQKVANHCVPNTRNCVPKFYCTNWQGGKCNPGAAVLIDGQPSWFTEDESTTQNCTPHG